MRGAVIPSPNEISAFMQDSMYAHYVQRAELCMKKRDYDVCERVVKIICEHVVKIKLEDHSVTLDKRELR